MAPPFFSVIIPTYNRATFLDRAVRSVLQQECSDWELLVIDDGSMDNTAETISSFPDERIAYHYQINSGRSAARNAGIAKAKGEYLCFLDDDDYFLPHHLSSIYRCLANKAFPPGIVRTEGYFDFAEKGLVAIPPMPSDRRAAIRYLWLVGASPIFFAIHKSLLFKHQFDTRFHYPEDVHLLIRLMLTSTIYLHINTTSTCVAEHADRSTYPKQLIKVAKILRWKLAVRQDLLDHYGVELHTILTPEEITRKAVDAFRMAAVQAFRLGKWRAGFRLLRRGWREASCTTLKIRTLRTAFFSPIRAWMSRRPLKLIP